MFIYFSVPFCVHASDTTLPDCPNVTVSGVYGESAILKRDTDYRITMLACAIRVLPLCCFRYQSIYPKDTKSFARGSSQQ